MHLTERDEQRFWAKVAPPNADGCMLWLAALRDDGYASFYQLSGRRRMHRAHRVAYFLAFGEVPPGLQVDHICWVRHCMAPPHLEAVTQQENIRRGNAGLHQRLKTHCPQGHEYTEANTRLRRDRNQRTCIICVRAQGRIATARYQGKRRGTPEQ